MGNKVVLGLSGGVDSAVSAALLARAGWEVACLYLDNGLPGAQDARAVAEALRLPFAVADIRAELEREVCAPFAAAYRAGRTPSPCALCNPTVKFPALLRRADELGAECVATGHYARVVRRGGRALLAMGQAPNDQSYLLARLTKEQLQRVIFPLSDYNKATVRALAEELGLAVAHKRDSMELCFVPGNDYAQWLEDRGQGMPPGDFVDARGTVLGRHRGLHRYTLGQGSGLGVSGPHKYYVSALRPETNQVVLSDGSDLYARTVEVRDMNWLGLAPITEPTAVTARFRHARGVERATLRPRGDDGVTAEMDEPTRAPTPGQLAVFYQGDTVAASGWIV